MNLETSADSDSSPSLAPVAQLVEANDLKSLQVTVRVRLGVPEQPAKRLRDYPLVTELDRNLGALAYNTYRGYVGGFSVHGEELPYWNGLTDTVKLAWMVAATAVRDEVTRCGGGLGGC